MAGTSDKCVVSLSDPEATLENVGGKGMSLAKMHGAGLPVPGGFHVTTAAYRRFVADNELQPRIARTIADIDSADTQTLDAAAHRIAAWFAEGRTPPEVAEAVASAYAALGDMPMAVRSSATAEDLPGASFAGQQESFLNIRGLDALLDAVKRCWASLWTARAIAYRINNQVDQQSVALAVVVQELVPADAAGVMFTANPVNGKRDELLINAAWGLGEAIVAGAVTPDTLTIQKTNGRVLRREIAEKSVMTIRAAEGTREVPVPASQQRQAVLSDKQVTELARLGVRIEQFYAMPMDIEWALAGGRFAIVQARPITALPPEWNRSVPEALYARNSLAEHIPGPLTPLFATLGFEVANRVNYHSMEGFLGKQNAQEMIPDRAEYEIINHYLYRRDYIRAKVVLKILAMYIPQFVRLARESAALTQAARQELVAVVEEWEQQSIERFSPAQLLDGVRTILAAAIRYYNQIQVTLPISATSEVLFTKAYESLIRGAGDPEALSFLLGLDTVAQRAELSLFDIAAWMRANPPVANYVFQHTTDRLVAGLGEETPPEALPVELWNEWRQRLGRHLHDFGRTAYEFDFANPTPQETPGPVIDALKAYLAGRTEDPRRRQREARDRRERATDALLQRLGWLRRALFVKLLRWAQDTGPMREDSIFDMGMGHPLMRRLLAELGRRFVAGGALAQAGDIYWLEQNEVEGLIAELERGAALPNLAARIPDRRAQWQAALGMSPPLMLPERSGWMRFMHGGDAETKNGKVVLKGIGTSGGRVTASARVLFGPEDFGTLKPGDVLVAVTTTPAWTPLFAQAAAVVTDIGGPLSHSSIVAREYGIPAVMAARSATRAIHNGQLITVDGNAGTVTVEN